MEIITSVGVFLVEVLPPKDAPGPTVMVFGRLIFVRDTGNEAENLAIATRTAEAASAAYPDLYRSQHKIS